ncbi:hypothetical protein [Dyadobacter sp. CY323]|uniref:hypothetical protein n=1 Tax=Dyadobacter sp. CY323 TaxID=2907302 RepID=UPI001F376AB4|nr:hypothetical protein [Dyadobacter sp. CY323]MCE6992377.1 hypothetical protein [Dyadobacter sp. CY323]
MKSKLFHMFPALLMVLSLPVSLALPSDLEGNFHSNPLLLNGHTVEYKLLSAVNRGMITLVKGNPESADATRVPFLIYLKRAGKIVNPDSHAHNYAVMQYEMAEILRYAKVGDDIVIDPASKEDAVGRRIIPVTKPQLGPQFKWFYGMSLFKNDGC